MVTNSAFASIHKLLLYLRVRSFFFPSFMSKFGFFFFLVLFHFTQALTGHSVLMGRKSFSIVHKTYIINTENLISWTQPARGKATQQISLKWMAGFINLRLFFHEQLGSVVEQDLGQQHWGYVCVCGGGRLVMRATVLMLWAAGNRSWKRRT